MSDTTTDKAPTTRAQGNPSTLVPAAQASPLVTEHGKTTISDAVVAKIAGIATREVSGVHALGGSTARAVGALRERIPGGRTNHSQGISVEVGEREAAVDLELVADYGVSITDLSTGIRRNVILAIERMTGLSVTEVNIAVQDVYLPSDNEDDDDSGDAPRVQ
ncbi:MAG: Asp23/Gls24 family envelope stress response protein [Cellulomonas sp.]